MYFSIALCTVVWNFSVLNVGIGIYRLWWCDVDVGVPVELGVAPALLCSGGVS